MFKASKYLNNKVSFPYFKEPFLTKTLYRLMKLDTSLTNNDKIIFRVKILLMNNEKYKSYKVIPIPIRSRDNITATIRITKPIFIIDEVKEHYNHLE